MLVRQCQEATVCSFFGCVAWIFDCDFERKWRIVGWLERDCLWFGVVQAFSADRRTKFRTHFVYTLKYAYTRVFFTGALSPTPKDPEDRVDRIPLRPRPLDERRIGSQNENTTVATQTAVASIDRLHVLVDQNQHITSIAKKPPNNDTSSRTT